MVPVYLNIVKPLPGFKCLASCHKSTYSLRRLFKLSSHIGEYEDDVFQELRYLVCKPVKCSLLQHVKYVSW